MVDSTDICEAFLRVVSDTRGEISSNDIHVKCLIKRTFVDLGWLA